MSQNESAQNEKNIRNFVIINKVASEYVKENNQIRKDILYKKLWEKCLGFLLKLDIAQESKILKGKIDKELSINEQKRENYKYDLNKTVDMDVFIETISYAIKKYSESPGEEFTRLFTSTYKIRKNAAVGIEGVRRKSHGFSSSENDKKMMNAFNKLITAYSEKDERFVGKQLHDLSRQDIHNILDDAGVGFKDEDRYVEIAQHFSNAVQAVELDNPLDGDEGIKEIAGGYDTDESATQKDYIINLFRNIIDMASKIQKKYFVCFITLELFNSYSRVLSEDMKSVIDSDFWEFINDYAMNCLEGNAKVPDAIIAKFLKVKAPAISKQRENYEGVLEKVISKLGR